MFGFEISKIVKGRYVNTFLHDIDNDINRLQHYASVIKGSFIPIIVLAHFMIIAALGQMIGSTIRQWVVCMAWKEGSLGLYTNCWF